MVLSGHFDTLPGGCWVREIKIIDHLSPAEAEYGNELGNTQSQKLPVLTQTKKLPG